MADSGTERRWKALYLDADVCIDYCTVEKALLPLLSRHIAPVVILLPALVKELSRHIALAECPSLEVMALEPTLEQVIEAGRERGSLSFYDRLNLMVAKSSGGALVTNDRRLRREAETEGIPLLWGLECLGLLGRGGHLPMERVGDLAAAIGAFNSRITPEIIARFRVSLGLPPE